MLVEWKPVSTWSAVPDLFVITPADDELHGLWVAEESRSTVSCRSGGPNRKVPMSSTSLLRGLLLGGVFVLLCSPAPAQQTKTIALVGGMLINGQNVAPVHNAVVLIQGDKIVQVGPAARVKIPPGATKP